MTRVYLPTTLEALARYVELGYVPQEVERFVAPGDDEESEYAALVTAGESAAALLDGPGRRVVLVAEVDDVDAAVAMGQVEAVHADTDDGAAPDDDLAWFATQEIPALLGG